MKRLLKWILVLLLIVIVSPFALFLGIYALNYSVVRVTPGGMKVNVAPQGLGAKVNPFSGTGGVIFLCAHNTPSATLPFGTVRLGPDTASLLLNKTGINRSGYYFGDNKILGFSHTRLVGADALEGGIFRVLPTVESRAAALRVEKNRFARFSHHDETAFPGYYAVRLPKDDVLCEMTATTRVGIHRYTFHKDEAPHLLLDVTSALGDKSAKGGVAMLKPEAREIEGTVKEFGSFSGRYGGLDAYFVARLSEPFVTFGTWNGARYDASATSAAGDDIGVDLGFEKKGADHVVELRLAISYVSIANARMNLDAEAPATKTFDDVYAAARDAWESRLGAIRVEGGTETEQRIFYTALYRACQMPTIFTDVNGEFMGFDRTVHKAEGYQYYTDFSMWDTFRAVQPLYNLILRKEERDMMVSLTEMAKEGGCFPRWPSGCGYTNCMFGTPSDVAVSEAYLKGIRDFDIDAAYKAMRQTALVGVPAGSGFGGRGGLADYLKLGYLPSDNGGHSVAATLEYAWADKALSLLAAELGQKQDADLLAEHARNYRNVWNPDTQHFEGKDSNGAFPKTHKFHLLSYVDFNEKYTRSYVEGSGEQWRWAVPYDAEGLMTLFKSRQYFVSELETYFSKARKGVGSLPSAYYWHGNEPYINAAYLFNIAERPDLTQKWVRWIMATKYSDDYIGLDGNDDGGTLSSWYVLSALGIYPIPGTTRYELGSPLFDKAIAKIDDKTLTVIAENNSPTNVYVQKVWLNDVPLKHTWFTHDQIAQGGTLKFQMGPRP